MGNGVSSGYSFRNVSLYFLMLILASTVSYRYIEFGHVKNWRYLFLLEGKARKS